MSKPNIKCAIVSKGGVSFAFCEASTPIEPGTWEKMRQFLLSNRVRFPSLTFAPLPVNATSPARFVGMQIILEDHVSPGNLKRMMRTVLTTCGFEFVNAAELGDWMRAFLQNPRAHIDD